MARKWRRSSLPDGKGSAKRCAVASSSKKSKSAWVCKPARFLRTVTASYIRTSSLLEVLLKNLAPPLGRAQSSAIKVGEHFLGRGTERDAFDSTDLGKTDQPQ